MRGDNPYPTRSLLASSDGVRVAILPIDAITSDNDLFDSCMGNVRHGLGPTRVPPRMCERRGYACLCVRW